MIPLLAVQSVEHKMKYQIATILGNYEFYYGAGRLARELSFDADGKSNPEELKEAIVQALEGKEWNTKEIEFLAEKMKKCNVSQEYNETMELLYQWGLTGEQQL